LILVKTFTGKTPCLRPVGGFPRQVLVWGLASPTSLRLARGVSASPRNLLVRTSSFRLRPRHGPHERGATPMHGLHHNDAWGTSSTRHASAPAGGTRWRPALTRAVMRHCSAARPPMCRPVRLCGTPTPLRVPPIISIDLRLGLNVADSTQTQTGRVITKELGGGARCP
jgi:hypothetical protein